MNYIYTIGHSNRQINDFINILLANKINVLADIRSIPGSNKNPQYNKEDLEISLRNHNIEYVHISKLGGLKNKSKNINSNVNNYWTNKSFRNYADYAFSNDDFTNGLEELVKLAKKNYCAIMCAEVLWWRCHRRIVTDYLLVNKLKVFHILDLKNIKEATINGAASITKDNKILYPKKN